MLVRILIWLHFGLAVSTNAYCQTNRIDGLLQQVHAAKGNEQQLAALLSLSEEYQSLNLDTFDVYGPVIKLLGEKTSNARNKSLAQLAYANWYFRWGWCDSALVFIEPEIAKNPVSNADTREIYFKLRRAQSFYHGAKSRYATALQIMYELVTEAERYQDTLNIGLCSVTIASIRLAMEKPAEAKPWLEKAIAIAKDYRDSLPIVAGAWVNKGMAYSLENKYDSADACLQTALPLCRQLQNLNFEATALRVQSNMYSKQKKYTEAETALLQMMAIRKRTGNASILVEDNAELIKFYTNSGQLDKAIALCKFNLKTGDTNAPTNGQAGEVYTNEPAVRITFLELLAGLYKQKGDTGDYALTLQELVQAKDAFYEQNSAEAIASLQSNYELQVQQNTILRQQYDLQRKNFLFYGALVVLLLVLTGGLAAFSQYKKRQKLLAAAALADQQNRTTLAIKNAEEQERKRIASDLHDNLGAYAASMASNLGYLQIPDADEKVNTAFTELKSNSNAIISQLNDTIWALKKDALLLTAISDRLKNFIHQLQRSYPTIQIEVTEEIAADIELPASQAFHLYRMLQEAINNALKHSKGTLVQVHIKAAKSWEARVTDNGVGMPANSKPDLGGYGLPGMQQRSKEAGWHVAWISLPEGGTQVLIAPTTN
ncbi:ATP-binding protein [Phnomibacter sp. MR]|uniref:tetratricopeptide repeat-containing sensor histidine kinase n=1 Tax=Phnomibacter sp. MR TaxID=3042318 RepID=UPI003A8007CF